jgi:hypothetical protein
MFGNTSIFSRVKKLELNARLKTIKYAIKLQSTVLVAEIDKDLAR